MTTSALAEAKAEQTKALDIIARALEIAKRLGATSAEATVSAGSGLSATVRLGEVEMIEHQRDKVFVLTVYRDGRTGSASTTDFSQPAIDKTVRAACDIAAQTMSDPCAGLAEPGFLAKEIPDLDLFHPWDLTPEQAIEIAAQCEQAARAADPRIRTSEGATGNTYRGVRAYGNSHGFAGGWPSTRADFGCSVIAEDDGGMQRDYWHTVSRKAADLEDAPAVGREAARRALRRLGARKITTRDTPVVFEARVARTLFGHFIAAISGGALYRKSSFLLDHLGKPVFADWLRIHEEPHLKQGLASAPFDDDGVATRPRDIVKDGVLKSYVLSAYSARKLKMQPTGNAGGVHNLIVEPNDGGLEDLLKQMDTGLLVTELMGFGVNGVTGDYSRGASGFWVESGSIQFPVEEITIAGNLKDMFTGIGAVANDIDINGNVQTGSVLIEKMTVAGA